MKPAHKIASGFLVGKNGVHLCAKATCDCVAELTRIIEEERAHGANAERWRERQLRLAKPRIGEALEETRRRLRSA